MYPSSSVLSVCDIPFILKINVAFDNFIRAADENGINKC